MPDNVLAFGQPRGINSMGDVANRMAQMGRNGDTELAHVNRDEIIIDRTWPAIRGSGTLWRRFLVTMTWTWRVTRLATRLTL